MKKTIKLPFGLNERNVLVHIADVETSANCNYFCPSCKSPLTPAKGTKIQHHFKHSIDSECEGGLESAIHLAAKQLIMEKKQITLPKYISYATALDSKNKLFELQETLCEEGLNIAFSSVEQEKRFDGMIFDILAIKGENELIIEIYYRHKVDENKIVKIQMANISAIEINLSDLHYEEIRNMKSFWIALNETNRVRWLYNSKAQLHQAKLEQKLNLMIREQEERYQQETIRKQRQIKSEKVLLMSALAELETFRGEPHIAHLQQEALNHPAWRYSKYLQVSLSDLPNYLNLDVPDGGWIFGCDKRIWQTAVYNTFIFRKNTGGTSFSIQRVDAWLKNTAQCVIPKSAVTIGKYGRRYQELLPNALKDNLPSSWKTLRAYFNVLCKLEMIMYIDSDYHYPGSCWYHVISKDPKKLIEIK